MQDNCKSENILSFLQNITFLQRFLWVINSKKNVCRRRLLQTGLVSRKPTNYFKTFSNNIFSIDSTLPNVVSSLHYLVRTYCIVYIIFCYSPSHNNILIYSSSLNRIIYFMLHFLLSYFMFALHFSYDFIELTFYEL